MQAALRADDEETARGYDTLLKLMQMRDRFLREKQVATKAAGRLTVAPVGLAPPDTSTSG